MTGCLGRQLILFAANLRGRLFVLPAPSFPLPLRGGLDDLSGCQI